MVLHFLCGNSILSKVITVVLSIFLLEFVHKNEDDCDGSGFY